MRRDEFVGVFGPEEVADLRRRYDVSSSFPSWPFEPTHLTARVNLVEEGAGRGVPESELLICCTSTGSEDAILVRAPGDGLNGSDVLGEAMGWRLKERVNLRRQASKTKRPNAPHSSCQTRTAGCRFLH